MEGHKPVLIALNVAVLVAFIIAVTFNGLSSNTDNGIFERGNVNVSDTYPLDITPAGWTFSIWGIIYAWQAAWILYSITLIFRSGPQGPLYLNPILVSPVLLIIYILNLGFNIGWLFLFDREILDGSYAFLLLIAITLYICLGLSYRDLERNKSALTKSGRKLDHVLVRALVHNGLGIYAAWSTIAGFLNMAHLIAYRSDPVISVADASSAALAGVSVSLVAYVGTDLTWMDKYSRYTLTPYCAVIFAMAGSLSKNNDAGSPNHTFSVVLLVAAVIALVVKIAMVVCRRHSKPIFTSDTDVTKENGTL